MNDTKHRSTSLQLFLVMGLPGSGKSVAAQLIAQRFNAVLLRTDVIRKELYPIPRYTPEEGQHVYQVMFDQAQAFLAEGRSVVLDATFRTVALRQQAQRIAAAQGGVWRMVLVTAPEVLVHARLATRRHDPSDATFETYQQLKTEFDAVEEPHTRIDNAGTLADLFYQVAALPPEP